MKKYNKTSDIVQTQVPSFFLDDYPTFVNFLTAYYKFLETQKINKNLESFRDIDTTLTEFVNELKSEFAHSSPNYANTKLYLAHLKQHFVSRGSEESYALLFRLLFNKDIEIQHPSESILRVSDGKWEQDYSIFVKVTSGNINDITNQFVYVQTSNKKVKIHILNVSVINQTESIYELFFDKQYYGILNISDTITFGDINAYIIPTTNSIKIVNGGKNFKVGQVFNIDVGAGSDVSIKVSKIGINGTMVELKIISFGVNHPASFFYAVSNSIIEAELFSYPLTSQIRSNNFTGSCSGTTLTTTGSPELAIGMSIVSPTNLGVIESGSGNSWVVSVGGTVASTTMTATSVIFQNPSITGYNDPTEPFVEGGFVNRQDYFLYSADSYSDGSYVGDVLTQFYSNNATTIDDNYALLQVKLGAVAKYPGAYLTTDSFLSGVSYIQDGNFYQDYSYVIKVDEKLDNYKNAVLQFLHPTGRKLFGEYSIQNNFVLEVQTVISIIRKQFPEYIHALDTTVLSISKLFSDSFGFTEVNSFVLDKPFSDSFTTSEINSYYLYKALADSFSNTDSISTKGFGKALDDLFGTTDSITAVSVGKALDDLLVFIETNSFVLNKPLADSFGTIDINSFSLDKALADSFSNTDSITTKGFSTTIDDLFALTDLNTFLLTKALADSFTTTDSTVNETGKALADSFSNTDSITAKDVIKALDDLFTTPDSITAKSVGTTLDDLFGTTDLSNFLLTKAAIVDSFSMTDVISIIRMFVVDLVDSLSSTDSITAKDVIKAFDEVITATDSSSNAFGKALDDLLGTTELSNFLLTKAAIGESVSMTDVISIIMIFVLNFTDSFSSTDSITAKDVIKAFDELITATDSSSNAFGKALDDSSILTDINTILSTKAAIGESVTTTQTGFVQKNPYNAEYYFAENYQTQYNFN